MPRYCVYLDNPEEEIWSKTSSECIFYDHKEEEIERKTSITECCCYYDHQENAVERKTSIFEKDKEDIIDYCKSLINNKFYGETIDRNRRFTTYNADASVLECMDNEIDFLSVSICIFNSICKQFNLNLDPLPLSRNRHKYKTPSL